MKVILSENISSNGGGAVVSWFGGVSVIFYIVDLAKSEIAAL